MSGIDASPGLGSLVRRALERLEAEPLARSVLAGAPAEIRGSLTPVLAGSDFVADSCARDFQLLETLLARGDLTRRLLPAEFGGRAPQLNAATPEAEA